MSFYNRYTFEEKPQLFAPISISSSGDNTVVAAVAGKRIRVVRYAFTTAAYVVVTWKSATAGAISGPMPMGNSVTTVGGGISEPEGGACIMQTAVGEALVINLGGAVSVGGTLTYILI